MVKSLKILPCSSEKNTSAFCYLRLPFPPHTLTACQTGAGGRCNCLGLDKATMQLQWNRGGETALGALARLQSNSHHVDRAQRAMGFPHPMLGQAVIAVSNTVFTACCSFGFPSQHVSSPPLQSSSSQSIPAAEIQPVLQTRAALRSPMENCTR